MSVGYATVCKHSLVGGGLVPHYWLHVACLHRMHGNANERRSALKVRIDVPMLGTIIEQNGDGLLEDSHMPVGWPLHIDGAVRQCCIHRSSTLQELDDMLREYDMKREFSRNKSQRTQWSHNAVWNWNRRQDTHCS